MRYFSKVKKFVDESFSDKHHLKHFERTVYWVKKLHPDANEAILIAAYAHDIERAFRKKNDNINLTGKKKMQFHQKEGAEIIACFLEDEGAEKKLIKAVKSLILKHEEGGGRGQDILKDADSISFFETNVDFFVNELIKKTGRGAIKEKFDWMFARISSIKAKRIAKPMYEKAMIQLE